MDEPLPFALDKCAEIRIFHFVLPISRRMKAENIAGAGGIIFAHSRRYSFAGRRVSLHHGGKCNG
jgi:hypothetical protein